MRRRAWIRWLPPMERASPSPVTTHTDRSGRVAAIPEAMAGARPMDGVHPDRCSCSRGTGTSTRSRRRRRSPPGARPRLGHELLDRGEDGVVPAAGAPPNLLIGLEVGAGVRRGVVGSSLNHLQRSSLLSRDLERARRRPCSGPMASTRNSALISLAVGRCSARGPGPCDSVQHLAEILREGVEVAKVGVATLPPVVQAHRRAAARSIRRSIPTPAPGPRRPRRRRPRGRGCRWRCWRSSRPALSVIS